MPRKRDESGQFSREFTLDEVVELFHEVKGPTLTSSDVADEFDCTPEAARRKLQRLVDQGKVAHRKAGKVNLYWLREEEASEYDEGDIYGMPDEYEIGITEEDNFERDFVDTRTKFEDEKRP